MPTQEASRQEQFSGTKAVAETHKFDERRLAAFLAEAIDDFKGPLEVRQFKGGQSNPTYQLITPGRKYVLRRKPPGKLLPSAHAVDREYRVIKALYGLGFPVAKPYALCTDDNVIGTMFYVMDCVEGRIFWEPSLPGLAASERRAIYDAMNATIAALHNVDYEAAGLEDFGRAGNYFTRQVSRWSKQYKASETGTIEAMDRLIAWLPEHIPAEDSSSIVHGDFRMDNMIFHATEPRVIAVLDWELSTIGHPLGDFTFHLMPWRMPEGQTGGGTQSIQGLDFEGLGIPTEAEYVAAYCARTGREGIGNMDYYMAYNFFRLAAIHQGIVGRLRDGTASNERAAQSIELVGPLSSIAWDFAKRAGA